MTVDGTEMVKVCMQYLLIVVFYICMIVSVAGGSKDFAITLS